MLASREFEPQGDIKIKVIWVQKRVNLKILSEAKKAKRAGSLVVYDCDESGSALSYWASPRLSLEMLHLADLVLVDTPERKKWIKSSLTRAPIAVIENEIDYELEQFKTKSHFDIVKSRTNQGNSSLRVLWYGNSKNIGSLQGFNSQFKPIGPYQLVICGADEYAINEALPEITAEIHEWDYVAFPALLRSCDVVVLSLLGLKADLRKSGHKMITAICHGTSVLASRTPDYERIAKAAGVDEYLFSTPSELGLLLRKISDPENRITYLETAQSILLNKYHKGSFRQNAIAALAKVVSCEQNNKRFKLPRALDELTSQVVLKLYSKLYWSHVS